MYAQLVFFLSNLLNFINGFVIDTIWYFFVHIFIVSSPHMSNGFSNVFLRGFFSRASSYPTLYHTLAISSCFLFIVSGFVISYHLLLVFCVSLGLFWLFTPPFACILDRLLGFLLCSSIDSHNYY